MTPAEFVIAGYLTCAGLFGLGMFIAGLRAIAAAWKGGQHVSTHVTGGAPESNRLFDRRTARDPRESFRRVG